MLPVFVPALIEALNGILFLFGYVSNTNSFPQPLTPEEELKQVEMYRNGSEEAKNILIERNLRLVAHIAKRYSSIGTENEDLISIGTIGLIKGIATFDPEKGARLSTYVSKCIENEIRMHIRSTSKFKSEISLHDPVSIDKDGNETALVDLLESESRSIDDVVDLNMKKKWLYDKMRTVLKGKEKNILELRYGLPDKDEKTQMEIAKMFGISRSYVSRIEKKAIKKLRSELTPKSCNYQT